MHYMGTGLVSSQPDEEQRKELGLATPSTQKGRFEILSLSGSFKPTDTGGAKSITGGMSVSLAGPDGRVMGGGLAGLLVAAGPVQVVIGSFIPVYQQEQKPKKQRSELAPTISPIPAVNHIYAGSTDAIYTGTMRSITPASYHGNGSADCIAGLRSGMFGLCGIGSGVEMRCNFIVFCSSLTGCLLRPKEFFGE